jgi:3-oxocholest-4-en-26-oyl-CoA dehydrogenase alpha subunit
MDFKFTAEQDKFRAEVRSFLESEIAGGLFKPMCDGWIQGFSPVFTQKLAQKGWIGLSWPKEFGGQGRSNIDRFILTEEILRYGAPAALHWFADRQIGRAIMHFGTDDQKKDMLPRILKGEAYVGLGMSEPEAGSDLGSLQTRAADEGDHYLINGQKMWTSCARYMNFMYLVARTDPNAPKHRGISEFVIPIPIPGINIVPTIDITGAEAWGEVFFDNVKIPSTALIGEKNRGFYQIVNQLDFERSGMERLMGNYPLFDAIVKFSKETDRDGVPLCKDPIIRDKLAKLQVEFEVGRLLTYRVAYVIDGGKAPNKEAAMAKVYCTAFEQHLADIATRILGMYGQLEGSSRLAPISGMASHSFLGSMGYSLQAGTSEILRNVVATRGLGLPEA